MTTNPSFKPGQIVPDSGLIKEAGQTGQKTVVQGERFPPTSKPGTKYTFVKTTPHKK